MGNGGGLFRSLLSFLLPSRPPDQFPYNTISVLRLYVYVGLRIISVMDAYYLN
jgi:hypothetical protein